MQADVLLLRPKGRPRESAIFSMEQLGLSYLAAVSRAAGLSVEIVDGVLEPQQYEATLKSLKTHDYQVIGFPVYPESVRRVGNDVASLRRRGVRTHVTVGNHLATLKDVDLLQDFTQFDSAIRGEGEYTLVDLAKARSDTAFKEVAGLTYRDGSRVSRNPPRSNAADLDNLPFPARDTLPLVIRAGNAPLVYSSRGCNARCDFCSVHNFFRAAPNSLWRARSPRNVVDELQVLSAAYGVRDFVFADEQFLGHGPIGVTRAVAIADEIVRRGLAINWYVETRATGVSREAFARLAQAGLRAVFMGLESGYDPALRQMRKGLRVSQSLEAIHVLESLEILPIAGFIMFRPDTSIEEMEYNLEFLSEAGCVDATALVTAFRVYSGTGLERSLNERGLLRGRYDDYSWRFEDARVADCYATMLDSADTLAATFNAYASLRRRGVLSYREAKKLQRSISLRPIEIMRDLIRQAVNDGGVRPSVRRATRASLLEACEDSLRVIELAQALANRQSLNGVRLVNPMYLC
jgi:radical SAM superfamily enzyme YgiQ (UPF0313 family)